MKKIGLIIIASVVTIVLVSQFLSSESNYTERVQKEREQLLSFMQRSSKSPFSGLEKPQNLYFFDIDPVYKVYAKAEKVKEKKLITIQKTLDKSDTYYKIMVLSFGLKGQKHKLCVYQNEENSNEILLPFSDLSNGNQTYETGRYLHLKKSILTQSEVELDFNLATNPYCAYNNEYSCPIPPRENSLGIEVLAGEKKYKK